jgi:hypothetical protein
LTRTCIACKIIDSGASCGSCLGRLITAWTCPFCKSVSHYVGIDVPHYCPRCRMVLPPIDLILNKEETRKRFHKGEYNAKSNRKGY